VGSFDASGNPVPDGLPDNINEGAVGLVIDDVDFGIGIFTPTALNFLPESLKQYLPKFVTVKAYVGYAGLVGVDEDILTVSAQEVSVNINTFYWPLPDPITSAAVNVAIQLFGPPTINWQTSFPNSPEDKNGNGQLDFYNEDVNFNGVMDLYEDKNNNGILDPGEDTNGDGVLMPSEDKNLNGVLELTEDLDRNGKLAPYGYALWAGGNNAVIFDFDGDIIQAKVAYAELNLAGFVQLSASMAFTKKSGEEVTLSNGEKTTVTTLAIGVNDANGSSAFPHSWTVNRGGTSTTTTAPAAFPTAASTSWMRQIPMPSVWPFAIST
jgi:hypothetical protein